MLPKYGASRVWNDSYVLEWMKNQNAKRIIWRGSANSISAYNGIPQCVRDTYQKKLRVSIGCVLNRALNPSYNYIDCFSTSSITMPPDSLAPIQSMQKQTNLHQLLIHKQMSAVKGTSLRKSLEAKVQCDLCVRWKTYTPDEQASRCGTPSSAYATRLVRATFFLHPKVGMTCSMFSTTFQMWSLFLMTIHVEGTVKETG